MKRAKTHIRNCVGIAVLAGIVSQTGAAERRYPNKWDWSPLQENEIKALAAKSRKAGDGFWALQRSGVLVRTDVSKQLAAEAVHHAAQAVKMFPQVIELPSSSTRVKNVRFTITIHRTGSSFAAAAPDGDPDEGFGRVRLQEDGTSVVEIHLLSAWSLHPGFSNNLVECIDVGLLQGHLARLGLQLWRPEDPLPPFLAKGYESFFETFNVYKKEPGAEGITRASFREALHEAILRDTMALRPSLSGMLHLSDEEFGKAPELNGAFSSRFVHFLMKSRERQVTIHQLLAQSTRKLGTGIDFKATAALENGWHRDLYNSLANSRLTLHSDLTTEGKLPGAASVSNLSAYGNKPLLALMPAKGGACDLAWYNRGAGSIHVLRCDAQGTKTAEFSPSFIKKAHALLGATRLGDKGYAVGYSTDNAHGNKGSEYWVAGFDPEGAELFSTRIFGDRNLSEENSKGGPGGAGTARIAYNEKTGTIAFYLAHNQLFGDGVRHQGGFIGFLDEKGNHRPGGHGWFYSHNFDQRLIVANGDFFALAHGDAYPRALGFSRWPGNGGQVITNKTYHSIPGEIGANTTHCQTGGLVALANHRYAVVFASSNERDAHDICIKILDETGKIVREKWLTKYEKGAYGAYPRIARDGGHIFLAWHQFGGKDGTPGLQQLVLDSSLETVVPRAVIANARLSPYDDLRNLDNGAIVWAVPVEGNKIRVYRIDQPAVMEQKLIAHNARVKRTPKSGVVARVNREMTIKLAELGADKNLPKEPIRLSSTKEPMRLSKVDKEGKLHFATEPTAELKSANYNSLPLRDRAVVALALSESEPGNRFLYAIAGFYLECAGVRDAAEFYYGKAGQAATAQFAQFFDE